jgi:peptidoglycan/LPS O-acetylase OafA/YrhL
MPSARHFGSEPLTLIGKISYGMYVFHLPILVLLRQWLDLPFGARSLAGISTLALYLGITVACSGISYVVFERRFLALKDTRFTRSRVPDADLQPVAVS